MKIIEYSLRYRPSADWIIKSSGMPYLKLDLIAPADKIFTEWQQVKDQAVDHRDNDILMNQYKNQGWKSLVLYGASATATEQFQGNLSWTSIAERCPNTVNWIKDNFVIGPNTGRIRFMLLEAGGYILPHADRDTKYLSEINVAINNPQGNTFRFLDYGTVPFNAGDAYMLDLSNKHFVYNNSEQDRLHIILHTSVKDELIEASYANCYYN